MEYKMYEFGPLATPLKAQGLPGLTDKQIDRYQETLDGLYFMLIQSIVTSKEYDRILDRLWKHIEKTRTKANPPTGREGS